MGITGELTKTDRLQVDNNRGGRLAVSQMQIGVFYEETKEHGRGIVTQKLWSIM